MARRLHSSVNVEGRWYKAGQTADEIGDAASRIGDHAWDGVDDDSGSGSDARPAPAPGAEGVGAGSEPGEVSDLAPAPADDDEDALRPPARFGKGSSEEAWREYAERVGVDVSRAEGRDGVVDALRKAGKPV
jgi:hypothetical protein